jgi:DNA-binding CsgD family transcriptional regulator
MKPQYNSPGIKFPARHRDTAVKNIISLLDVSMKVKELKHDIVLNIRFDSDKLSDFLRYFVVKSFSEEFSLSDQNNESPVKELIVNEKDLTTKLFINDETHLTSRQIEVMEQLSKGRNYKEIADELGIKFNTVSNHLQHIYPKLGAGNRSEASLEYLKSRDKHKKLSPGE